MELVFEEPPISKRGPGSVNPEEFEIAESLRNHAGEWARVFTKDTAKQAGSLAANIRAGKRKSFGPGFETTTRTLDGKGVVYVRYVGDV